MYKLSGLKIKNLPQSLKILSSIHVGIVNDNYSTDTEKLPSSSWFSSTI